MEKSIPSKGKHILQLFDNFHRNPMQRLEVMAQNVDFGPF